MSRFLFVSWDSGGGLPSYFALGKRLVRRGHAVTMLGPETIRAGAETNELAFRPLQRTPAFDASAGRATEDQMPWMIRHLAGPEVALDVAESLDDIRPDGVLLDFMQPGAFAGLEKAGYRAGAFVHTLYTAAAEMDPLYSAIIPMINEWREEIGVRPLDPDKPLFGQLLASSRMSIAATIPSLDEGEAPRNLRYVGPVFDPDPPSWDWDLPWPAGEPMVVVSFSSTYQHQEQAIAIAAEAAAGLSAHVLVTLGPSLEPAEVKVPDGVAVRQFVPHHAVMPHASGVVTHAGLSTVLTALGHGVPLVCIPQGRDQATNARRVQESGAGLALPPDALRDAIQEAAGRVLSDPSFASTAAAFALEIRRNLDRDLAADTVEELMG